MHDRGERAAALLRRRDAAREILRRAGARPRERDRDEQVEGAIAFTRPEAREPTERRAEIARREQRRDLERLVAQRERACDAVIRRERAGLRARLGEGAARRVAAIGVVGRRAHEDLAARDAKRPRLGEARRLCRPRRGRAASEREGVAEPRLELDLHTVEHRDAAVERRGRGRRARPGAARRPPLRRRRRARIEGLRLRVGERRERAIEQRAAAIAPRAPARRGPSARRRARRGRGAPRTQRGPSARRGASASTARTSAASRSSSRAERATLSSVIRRDMATTRPRARLHGERRGDARRARALRRASGARAEPIDPCNRPTASARVTRSEPRPRAARARARGQETDIDGPRRGSDLVTRALAVGLVDRSARARSRSRSRARAQPELALEGRRPTSTDRGAAPSASHRGGVKGRRRASDTSSQERRARRMTLPVRFVKRRPSSSLRRGSTSPGSASPRGTIRAAR